VLAKRVLPVSRPNPRLERSGRPCDGGSQALVARQVPRCCAVPAARLKGERKLAGLGWRIQHALPSATVGRSERSAEDRLADGAKLSKAGGRLDLLSASRGGEFKREPRSGEFSNTPRACAHKDIAQPHRLDCRATLDLECGSLGARALARGPPAWDFAYPVAGGPVPGPLGPRHERRRIARGR